MTTKRLKPLLAAAMVALAATGCLSSRTTPETTAHALKVVDAVTKLPVAGAHVKLSAPGMTMVNRTDERGTVDFGALAFHSRPKPEEVEVTMQGYNRVWFRLTNGLPHTVEITPGQGQK